MEDRAELVLMVGQTERRLVAKEGVALERIQEYAERHVLFGAFDSARIEVDGVSVFEVEV